MPSRRSICVWFLVCLAAIAVAAEQETSASPQVTLYVAKPVLQPGEGLEFVVRLANGEPQPVRYFGVVGINAYQRAPDGSVVPLPEREPPVPTTEPAHVPVLPRESPTYSLAVETERPYAAGSNRPLWFDMRARGKVEPRTVPAHESVLIDGSIPDWAFGSGECSVTTVLYDGKREVARSQRITIHVDMRK